MRFFCAVQLRENRSAEISSFDAMQRKFKRFNEELTEIVCSLQQRHEENYPLHETEVMTKAFERARNNLRFHVYCKIEIFADDDARQDILIIMKHTKKQAKV